MAQNSGDNTGKAGKFRFERLTFKSTMQGANAYGNATGNTNPSPDGSVSRLTIYQLIMVVYGPPDYTTVQDMETRNMPDWARSYYAIVARVADEDLYAWQHQRREHELLRAALRTALKERCKLAFHDEPSRGEATELVLGKNGPQLQAANPRFRAPGFTSAEHFRRLASGGVAAPELVDGKQVATRFHGATMLR